MRKILCLTAAIIFSISFMAFAENVIKDKLIIGTEWNSGEKNIENLNALQIGLAGFLDASLVMKTENVKVNQYLTTLGYKISDNLIPYAILGYSRIGLDQSLSGSIALPWFSGSTDLTEMRLKEGAFTYGLGANGKLAEIKGIALGYDVRYLMFSIEETDQKINLLPSLIGIELNNKQKLDYNELDLSLIASKEIAIDSKVIKAITPYIGYQFSNVALLKKNNITVGPLSVGTEANLKGNTHSALVGACVKVNDNWSVSAGAIINENVGVQTKVTYRF
jgi:hypothetical protein